MLKSCVGYVAERPPFSWFRNNEVVQFLMLGQQNAGKTTLLYRLKIEGWKRAEIIRDMHHMKKVNDMSSGCKDPAYHYEELSSSKLGRYGIWEIPGNPVMMRLWPMFYRYVRISCVVFVVDAFSKDWDNMDMLSQARQQIHFLLNEDELRCAAFFLILNVSYSEAAAKTEEDEQREMALYEMLGVPEIEAQKPHAGRFFKFAANCAEMDRDSPKWEKLLQAVLEVSVQMSNPLR